MTGPSLFMLFKTAMDCMFCIAPAAPIFDIFILFGYQVCTPPSFPPSSLL